MKEVARVLLYDFHQKLLVEPYLPSNDQARRDRRSSNSPGVTAGAEGAAFCAGPGGRSDRAVGYRGILEAGDALRSPAGGGGDVWLRRALLWVCDCCIHQPHASGGDYGHTLWAGSGGGARTVCVSDR